MNIAIIGAGATGLSAAWDLAHSGHTVTVYEAAQTPGGLAAGFKEPHWKWSLEKFYHHWFASDADLLKLADEIGVRQNVIYKKPKTVSYWNGSFYPLDSPLAALTFPGLSVLDKIPFGLAGVYLKLLKNGLRLENQTAHAWASKHMGKAAYQLIFEPLLQGKYGDALYREVNMAWLWARIKSRTPSLGTFEGGFQAFFNHLAEAVKSKGVTLNYDTRVTKLERQEAGDWRVTFTKSSVANLQASYDSILVTTSPKLMSALAPQLPANYLSSLNNLKSLGAIVVVFALNQPLSPHGYYWHSLPKGAGFPFLALCEHTNFVPNENFGGDHLIYCGDYLPADSDTFAKSDDDIAALYLSALNRFNPAFEPSWLRKFWVFREAYAQPVPFVNHSQHIPATQTPLPGLFFASMSQVYPWDRGTNYAVKLGREVAGAIAPAMTQRD